MSYTVVRTQAQVGIVYVVEQWQRGGLVFDRDAAAQFGRRMAMGHVGIQVGERSHWRGSHGIYEAGTRRVRVIQVHGNEFELGTLVDGTSADAHDVLEEAWNVLGEINGDAPIPLSSVTGAVDYTSTAIVTTAQPFTEWLGPVGRAAVLMRDKLGDRALPSATSLFEVKVPVRVKLKGIEVDRALSVQQRFYAESDAGMYWVSAPVPSDDLEAILRALFS